VPRPTIKSLEAQLKNLRELREIFRKAFVDQRNQNEYHKQELERIKKQLSDSEQDRRWLKQLIQTLATPSQERTRF
jgi:hypothetical protein